MKKKATMLLALLCGIVCALAVFTYTGSVRSEADQARSEALARYGGEQIQVCVATRDIAPGETVNASNVTMKMWLADLLPEKAVESLDEAAGRQVTSQVLKGEVLSSKRFEGTANGVAVPAGLQAVGVEVGNAQAVGGALRAGMKVDVYAVGASGTGLIASDALVVAAGDASSRSSSWVTLAVSPEHVQELISATQKTELYFALPGVDEKG